MMGWTGTHATHYKDGEVDRKAECDAYFLEGVNTGRYKVVKSSMVGSTYYAAIQNLVRKSKDGNGEVVWVPITEEERETWAAVFLTSVNNRDYFNFSYKEMDETCGPAECNCPESILKLLTPTENEDAQSWRRRCREEHQKEKRKSVLNQLPNGSRIQFELPFDTNSGEKKGDIIQLFKAGGYMTKPYWSDGQYRWNTKLIPVTYEVLVG